jgi:hypothetical protein
MTTFTLRASSVMAACLSSAKTRTWLDAFLGEPHDILQDPGPGQARVSLTLPEAEVKAVAAYLRCSPSSALRRLAGERLRTSSPMTTPAPHVIAPRPATLKSMTPQSPAGTRPPAPARTTALTPQQDNKLRFQGEALVAVVFVSMILLLMAWFLFVSRKKKANKTA